MSSDVFLAGVGVTTLEKLEEILDDSKTESLFFASAFVTQNGVDEISDLIDAHGVKNCGVVFGLDGYVTEPKAIKSAQELGWTVRLISSNHIFHPKVALTGGELPDPFSDGAQAGYIGSANFTGGGLDGNIEAGIITRDADLLSGLTTVASEICKLATPVDEVDLDDY